MRNNIITTMIAIIMVFCFQHLYKLEASREKHDYELWSETT